MSNLTVKRLRKFQSVKSPSMELPLMPTPNHRGEIFHFSHRQHPLVLINLPYLFTCMGCKEYGAGNRFKCQICEFELHDFCALAPPSLQKHPLHPSHQLVFFAKSGGLLRSNCGICGKATKGFNFRCASCSFEMHPCCATMLGEMSLPTHAHPLNLSLPMATKDGDSSIVCELCRKKRPGLVYCCFPCGYNLHASCVKDMVNGLYVHGINPPQRTNMVGAAAKLATHAIFGIIGGLIEGIGEGIGDALIENIGRGTRNRRRSN